MCPCWRKHIFLLFQWHRGTSFLRCNSTVCYLQRLFCHKNKANTADLNHDFFLSYMAGYDFHTDKGGWVYEPDIRSDFNCLSFS
ncbi:hypothetical protein EAM_0130 [Erwinia amylovora ATCC 49946]|nr:hypothetical protein EAM_0130 [Erwinia amylovora ATCC 49946]